MKEVKEVIELNADDAKKFFLKGESYFNVDLPSYFKFEKLLHKVQEVLGSDGCFMGHASKQRKPRHLDSVNYSLISNKDGRFAWRHFELIHPIIYVSLVNTICRQENWETLKKRFAEFKNSIIECHSIPLVNLSDKKQDERDVANQISTWWRKIEQRSIELSLEYTHLLHTDVTNCYGSVYTHSIPWAIHSKVCAKKDRSNRLFGNVVDSHISSSRHGQTNGIPQGSVLMDFIAELVLGYVDTLCLESLDNKLKNRVKVLRYRDDYRIFASNDYDLEQALKCISDSLRQVGMKLGVAKTFSSENVVSGSVKQDKLSSLEFGNFVSSSAKTLQKQMLRLHNFSCEFTNSGSVRRLTYDLYLNLHSKRASSKLRWEINNDFEVLIAIAVEIGSSSPASFPIIAGIIGELFYHVDDESRKDSIWTRILTKMRKIPHNTYVEIWLQRIHITGSFSSPFCSQEKICQYVGGKIGELWDSSWVSNKQLKKIMGDDDLVVGDTNSLSPTIEPVEIELFRRNLINY